MKKNITISALLFSVFIGVQLSAQGLPGVPVFGDDFNVKGLFVENWESTKDAKTEGGQAVIPANNNIKLRRIPEGNFAFTADLTIEKPEGKLGHCGVILDGIHFMITPTDPPRVQTAYRLPSEERSRGTLVNGVPGLKLGEPCRVYVSREQLGEGYKYSYKVNDQPIATFQTIMPDDGRITFYGYRTNMKVDNFQLYSLKEGNGSNNLAVNSSFEYLQEGMPNYMKPFLGGRYTFDGKWEDFLKDFAIDTKEKVSGNQSARMTSGLNHATSNGISTYNVNVMAKTPVTFSIYLKASEDDFPVTLNIWELHHKNHNKPINITKEWERYTFTLDHPERATVRGGIRFDAPGTVWADDIQVEIGSEATEYLPSSLDQDKYTAGTEKRKIEDDLVLRKTDKAPVIDGVLEDLWFENAVKTDKFFLKGSEAPKNKTEAYLTYDEENLYVAVRAHVPDSSKVKGTEFEHDNLKAHGEDCIEVFLDTTFGRKEYYHLTSNAAGSKTDIGPGRILGWNGEWEVATQINEQDQTIDYEMKYPLRLFAGINLAGKWGINIGRHDTDRNEVYSLTHMKTANFHEPEIYPSLVFPDGALDDFKVGLRDLYLTPDTDSQIHVAGVVGNLSGKTLDAEVQILDKSTGREIGKKKLTIADGNTEIRVPVRTGAGVNVLECTVNLFVDGEDFLSHSQRINVVRELEMYTRYNYYMNEDAAVLVGSLGLPQADQLTGRIRIADQRLEVKMESEFAIDLPLKGLANGEHQITLDVYNGDKKQVSGSTKLVKRAFKNGATQIDRQRRCLVVDGEPYLVIAPFFGIPRGIKVEEQDEVLQNMLRLHKEMGYTCFLVGAVDDEPVHTQAQEFINLCAEEGIKVVYWPFMSWRQREKVTPEQRLEMVKGENIIATMVVDEPELYAQSDEVEIFLEAFRKISPYTPMFMNNTRIGIPGRFAGLKTDILMLDDYLTNRENRKVMEMIDATTMMMEAGKEERIPAFYFLAGENLHNHYREPTYAEQVAQTYGVIIAGASGVSYFTSLPLYPEDYRASVDVNRELLELEDVIFSLEKTSEAAITDSVVTFMTRRLDDKIYIIALNADNDRAAEVEITLPAEFSYADKAQVKFEDRNINVANGVISDHFDALERHVYVIELEENK